MFIFPTSLHGGRGHICLVTVDSPAFVSVAAGTERVPTHCLVLLFSEHEGRGKIVRSGWMQGRDEDKCWSLWKHAFPSYAGFERKAEQSRPELIGLILFIPTMKFSWADCEYHLPSSLLCNWLWKWICSYSRITHIILCFMVFLRFLSVLAFFSLSSTSIAMDVWHGILQHKLSCAFSGPWLKTKKEKHQKGLHLLHWAICHPGDHYLFVGRRRIRCSFVIKRLNLHWHWRLGHLMAVRFALLWSNVMIMAGGAFCFSSPIFIVTPSPPAPSPAQHLLLAASTLCFFQWALGPCLWLPLDYISYFLFSSWTETFKTGLLYAKAY